MKKSTSKIQYCVPPLLVDSLETQAAAHFLIDFSTNMIEHIRGVVSGGLRGKGGLTEEIQYWFQSCEADAKEGGSLGRWDTEVRGRWVYDDLPVADIANAVWYHTRGWKAVDYEAYGKTVEEYQEMETGARELA